MAETTNPYAAQIGDMSDNDRDYRILALAMLAVGWEVKQMRAAIERLVSMTENEVHEHVVFE